MGRGWRQQQPGRIVTAWWEVGEGSRRGGESGEKDE